jgi:hypothetical protein
MELNLLLVKPDHKGVGLLWGWGPCVEQIARVSTCSNLTMVLLWLIMGLLVYYIKLMTREVCVHHHFPLFCDVVVYY